MGLLTVERVRYNDGMKNAVMDINVGDTSDLPALGAVVLGLKIMATSFACDKSGTFYKLHNDGEWYICDGSGNTASESSLNASLSMSPTLNKAIAQSDGDTINLTEGDIDKISDELSLEPFPEPVEEKKAKATESEVTEDER